MNQQMRLKLKNIKQAKSNPALDAIPTYTRPKDDLQDTKWFEHHYVNDPCDDVVNWFKCETIKK